MTEEKVVTGQEMIEMEQIKQETTDTKEPKDKIGAKVKAKETSIEKETEEKDQDTKNKKDAHVFAVPGMPELKDVKNPVVDTKQNKESDNVERKIKTEESDEKSKPPTTPSAKKCPLEEPPWGGIVPETIQPPYSITILKDGIVKDTINLTNKSRFVFGRSDDCDIRIEHPSCSRYHAVLQYCLMEKDLLKKGFYLYDMDSSHGTCLNKVKIKPNSYNRVRVGYQLKFGGSTRLYIVEGPMEDQEEETDIDKMREKKRLYKQHQMEAKQKRKPKEQPLPSTHSSKQTTDGQKESDSSGCDDGASWGFGEDAQEEGINLKDLFERKQDFEVKDPKKTLNGFFEREGIEFEYEMSERGQGKSTVHVAKVRLPFDTDDGEEVIAEGTSSNKKDAVLDCATEACRLIQTYDMMTNKTREDQRVLKQRALEANDFYDSDEDNFLDRTGNIEKKRMQRKKRAGKQEKDVVETHDTLKVKLEEKKKEIQSVDKKLILSKAAKEQEEGGGDSLDSFMSSMTNRLDKTTEIKLKRKSAELKKEIQRLEKMVEITKPALLPSLNIPKQSLIDSKKETAAEKAHQPQVNRQPAKRNSRNTSANHDIKMATMSTAQILRSQPKSFKDKSNPPEEQKENGKTTTVLNDDTSKAEEQPAPPPAKKKKVYSVPTKPDYKPEKEFVDWTPPTGQTGDGRTALNDKLGY